jgi:hypothetical protein
LETNYATHGLLYAQTDKTNGNTKFLQLYPIAAADVLTETILLLILYWR